MTSSMVAVSLCFVALHGGPADHFATFAEELNKKGQIVQIYANGAALKKFQDRKIQNVIPFTIDDTDSAAVTLAKKCADFATVITDIGHPFDIELHKALKQNAPKTFRVCYYDNPESEVPGEYSVIAKQVMQLADRVLLANANLTEYEGFDIPFNKRKGIGYYPLHQVEKLAIRRGDEHDLLRAKFLKSLNLNDQGQKILVYVGGNNSVFFNKAFPAFLKILKNNAKELTNHIILYQRHPSAKVEDLVVCVPWKEEVEKEQLGIRFEISKLSSEESLILGDTILYYQTSMAPQFLLLGIPTIQIGHAVFEDLLIQKRLCQSVTPDSDFAKALTGCAQKNIEADVVTKGLGLKEDWSRRFELYVKPPSKKTVLYVSIGLLALGIFGISFLKKKN